MMHFETVDVEPVIVDLGGLTGLKFPLKCSQELACSVQC